MGEQNPYQRLNHQVTVHPQGVNNTKHVHDLLLLHLLQQLVQGNEGATAAHPSAESTGSQGQTSPDATADGLPSRC